MIVKTYYIKYTRNKLINYFDKISNKPWAMLLTSGKTNDSNNRYDILTADPLVTFVTHGNITKITKGNTIISSYEDPLNLVQQQCNILSKSISKFNHNLPFQGGAIGLFGYDLGRRFEKLPQHAISDLMTPDMAIGIYDWALIADHHLKQLILVSLSDINIRWRWLSSKNKFKNKPFVITSKWRSNFSFTDYAERFKIIQNYIQNGDCYQVNLSQRFQANYYGSEWNAFLHLNKIHQAPFSAFIRLPTSTIISLSPERFLLLDQQKIETRPIKGTILRLLDPIADYQQVKKLTNSEKERAENLMIVDLLRNDIGRVAIPGSISVPELFVVEHFQGVHHLVSTIRACLLKNLLPVDLLRACFPGGSITGAPKIRAMEIIEELEPNRRNAWCGSIGYISVCKRMDTNITIRTLIAENKKIYCSAGGGLVADSILEEEYQETLHKINHIMLNLHEY